MKIPESPRRPYAPYKPNAPAKQVEEKTKLGDLISQEDGEFSIQWLTDYIRENFPTVDPHTIKFSMEINTTHGYYDQISTNLDFHFYTVGMIDNPNYDIMFKHYEQQLEKYHKDYEKYKADIKQYKIDEKKYKKDFEQWQLENAKAIIDKLEKKKSKNK